MKPTAGFNDPIKIQWNINEQGEKISVEMQPEPIVVSNNAGTLIQIPDKFYRVQINEYIDPLDITTKVNDYDYIEIINDEIIPENGYRVDYQMGLIFFHPSKEGQTITITKYYGRGIVRTPVTRIYSQVDEQGNVVETLGDILNSQVRNFIFSTDEPPADTSLYPNGSVWFVYDDTII